VAGDEQQQDETRDEPYAPQAHTSAAFMPAGMA
jgi:hypothetical protein